jgi:hypothetical protein
LFLAILLASLVVLASQGSPGQFQSAVDALSALDHMTECKCDTDVKAYRYFINHPDESIPLLMDFTLKHKQRHHVGVTALSKMRDERVIMFLLQLADDELHDRANTISSDNSNNERHPYDSEGLISHLIDVLGNYGDKRAIPIIEESLGRLNNQHRDGDLEALCKLGKISVSELYARHLESVEEIHKIACSNVYANPKFSIEVYDWIINRFPQRPKLLESCHAGKVMALYNAQEYALALSECGIIKQNIHSNSPEPMSFAVDHRSYSLDEMIELLKAKVEIKK